MLRFDDMTSGWRLGAVTVPGVDATTR